MAHIMKARVAETSTSTGTGDFTLSGAVTAHKTFASRMSVADTTEYVIYAVDGSGVPTGEWEEGTGTYSAANTLTRTTVAESSNSDAAVNFGAGSKVVIMTPLASRVGALIQGGAAGDVLLKTGTGDFAWGWSSLTDRVRATVLTGLSTATATVVTAAHTVLEALGFLQKQVSDNATAIAAKQATLVSGTNIKTVNSTSLLGSGNISVTADLTAPGPIGGTTPSTISATTVSASGAVTATKLVAQRSNLAAIVESGTTSSDYKMRWATGNSIQFCNGDASGYITVKAGSFDGNWSTGGYGFQAFNGGLYCLNPNGPTQVNMTAKAFFATGTGLVSYDTAWERSAAGVMKSTDGSGNARDVSCRSLIGTGNLATGIAAKTAAYTATTSDGTIECDATTEAFTITLFACSGNAGKIIIVKKTDASINAVTVDGNASETIDGAATATLATQYSDIILQVNSAGTGWHKLSGM